MLEVRADDKAIHPREGTTFTRGTGAGLDYPR
jgi:hypothetical protein